MAGFERRIVHAEIQGGGSPKRALTSGDGRQTLASLGAPAGMSLP